MQEDKHAQIIVDLMRQAVSAPAGSAPPAASWVQGNHNIVITGGSVSIHMAPSSCTAIKGGCDE